MPYQHIPLKISEGPSRTPVNRQATPTGVTTYRLRTAALGGSFGLVMYLSSLQYRLATLDWMYCIIQYNCI